MAVVSRLELNHPALGTAGGASLHSSIEALYQKIGDAVSSRWFAIADFDQTETVDLDHNFTTDISNLRYDLMNFTGGEWVKLTAQTTPPVSAFTVIEKAGFESTVLQITNNTGGNDLTFAVSVVFDPIYVADGDIKDIDITGVTDKQLLVYDNATKKFLPSNSLEGKTLQNLVYGEESGAAATTIAPTKAIFRVTSGTQIDMINPTGTKVITIMNDSGASLLLKNLTGATAAYQIITGTGSDLTMNDQTSLQLAYDSTDQKFRVVGGAGSGGGLVNVFVNAASSPVTGEIGKFYLVDTTAGEVIINQPQISTIPASQFELATMLVADVKGNFHVNKCTVVRGGTDTQNYTDGTSDTSIDLDTQGITVGFNADSATSWALTFGPYPTQTTTPESGQGGTNYFPNGDFTTALGLNFWSKTGNFSSLSLATGAGALKGDNSLAFTLTSPGVGQVKTTLDPIDPVYYGKTLQLSGSIKITGTGTGYTASIYNVDTATTLVSFPLTATASGNLNDLLGTIVGTADELEFRIESATGVAADAFLVDVMNLDPEGGGIAAVIGNYTSIPSPSLVNAPAGTLSVKHRRVGSALEVEFFFQNTSTSAVASPIGFDIAANLGLTVDTSAIVTDTTGTNVKGSATYYNTISWAAINPTYDTSTGFIQFRWNDAATAAYILGNNFGTTGRRLSAKFSIPVVEYAKPVQVLDNGQIYQNATLITESIAGGAVSTTSAAQSTIKYLTTSLAQGITYNSSTGAIGFLFSGKVKLNAQYLCSPAANTGASVISVSNHPTDATAIYGGLATNVTVGTTPKVDCELQVTTSTVIYIKGYSTSAATFGTTAGYSYLNIVRVPDSSANQLTGAGTSLITNSVPSALLMISSHTTITLDNSFTGGVLTVDCLRIGNLVILSGRGNATHASSTSVGSSLGLVPIYYRPTDVDRTNSYYTGFNCKVLTNGQLLTEYSVARVNTGFGLLIFYYLNV